MIRRRTPSASSSVFGILLLVLIVLVTAAGIGSAIYLEQTREPAQNAQTVANYATVEHAVPARLPSEVPPEPRIKRETSPPPLPPPPAGQPTAAATLPAIEPAAGPPRNPTPSEPNAVVPAAQPAEPSAASAPPQQIAALEAPTALSPPAVLPPLVVETPEESKNKEGFWIEYGVYAGRLYAERLQRSLMAVGLAADITTTQTPAGRPLLRVRSAVVADRGEARAMARKAERALGIATLLHTTTIIAPAPAIVGRGGKNDGPYWVQFGSFAHPEQAKRLQSTLRQGGIIATVIKTQELHHKPLFVIRSVKISTHQAALTLASLGNEVMSIDHWVARAPLANRDHGRHRHAHAPPPHGKRGSS